MKSKHLLFTMLLALVLPWTAMAQQSVTNTNPENLAITPSTNGATVTWVGAQPAYNVYWGAYDANNGANYTQQALGVAGSVYSIDGLQSGQSYSVKVEGICGDQVTEGTERLFTTAMLWTEPTTWDPNGTTYPGQNNPEPVEIPENMTVMIPADANIEVTEITMNQGSQIIIEEGGMLAYTVNDPDNDLGINVTMTMAVTPALTKDNNAGYRLIASPVYETINVEDCGLTENFDGMDLYSFDASYPHAEWRNYKTEGNFTDLEIGKGYLYYNSEMTFVTFFGQTIPSNVIYPIDLTYAETAMYDEWKGLNLVGNPFTCKATPNKPFYVLNDAGDEVVTTPSDAAFVGPMKGFFVMADNANDQCMMVKYNPATQQSALNMTLSQNQSLVDRAVVNFGKGENLRKIQLNPNHTKLYMPMDNSDYAAMYAEEQGEMPVSFKAENNGNYTLSFENVNVEFSYLHLIDNMTGTDQDLLANPSYSFSAKSSDHANRFRLVYATGSSTSSDSFSFINGDGNLAIYGIDGEATVQVVNVLGHVISSETFSGSYEKSLNVAPGVYMIRLIQGNDTKVQRMVIK